jgi:hypothetical protein
LLPSAPTGASIVCVRMPTTKTTRRVYLPRYEDAAGEVVGMVGARGVGPRLTRSSGIWIPRLYRGRVFVTMGGARPLLRSVRST